MAVTAIAGVAGSFTFAGHVARVMQWEVTSVQDVNDASGFGGSSNWRINLAGMKGYRFRASGYVLDSASSQAPGADFASTNDAIAQTFTLSLRGSTSTYTGSAIPASFVIGTGVNGNATFSVEAVGTGALVEANAAS